MPKLNKHIQIDEQVWEKLSILKVKWKLRSLNEAIEKLLEDVEI